MVRCWWHWRRMGTRRRTAHHAPEQAIHPELGVGIVQVAAVVSATDSGSQNTWRTLARYSGHMSCACLWFSLCQFRHKYYGRCGTHQYSYQAGASVSTEVLWIVWNSLCLFYANPTVCGTRAQAQRACESYESLEWPSRWHGAGTLPRSPLSDTSSSCLF